MFDFLSNTIKQKRSSWSIPSSTLLMMLKVSRDALSQRATSLSLVLLVMLGTALFVALAQVRVNLEASYRQFYKSTHFADATIWVDGAPPSLLATTRLIPGVRQVMGRQVKNGTLLLRDKLRRQVTGRFIATPIVGRPPINDIAIVHGRYLSAQGECLLERSFARENKLQPGERITGIYQGKRHDFLIVGIVTSPEYLYPVPSKESSFVSPQTFGVCWINEDEARSWLGLGNLITEIHVLCDPGQSEPVLKVLRSIGERYGLRTYWTQDEQPSNHTLQLDIQGFQVLSIIFPLLFMLAAALSLYSSLSRVVQLQTGIIGFLRASGFSQAQLLWHYLSQAGLVVIVGSVPGLIIGHFLSISLLGFYQDQLSLPTIVTSPHPGIMAAGLAVVAIVAALAAWIPARRAARTSPAIAMRGVDGNGVAPLPVWTLTLTRRLPILFRIPARSLLGRPSRTAFVVGGLTCGASLLLVSVGMWAAITSAMNELLNTVYRYELDVGFVGSSGKPLSQAVSGWSGVEAVNQTCATIVKARSLQTEESLTLIGVQRGQSAVFMPKYGGGVANIKPGDFWMSWYTAQRLHVEPGDPLSLEWAYSSRQKRVRTVGRVGGLLDISFGGVVFGEYSDVRRRLVDRVYPEGVYGAQILCSRSAGQVLRRRFEQSELTASVTSLGDVRDQVHESLKITLLFVSVLVAFSAILAGAVLHSVSSVGIMERLRELATLRSLGFSANQTSGIATVEIYALATVALLFGLPLGSWMNVLFLSVYNTDVFYFRPSLPLWTFATVIGIVYSLVTLSLRQGMSRLRNMDLAQATKARE